MKIVSIELKNFIQFKGDNLVEFSDGLNLINGSIGGGKSSFFNAFYWCLFNKIYITDEGWISNPDKSDVVNAIVFNSLKNKEKAICKVSLEIETKEDYESTKTVNYKISRSFEIRKTENSYEIDKNEFDLFYDDPDRGTIHESNDYAATIIENLIFPKVLSDYVWFQGESLDKLIDLEKSASFKKVIDSISYLNFYDIIKEVLEKTEKKLNTSLKKKLSQNSNQKKKIREINFKFDQAEKNLTPKEKFEEMQAQIDEFDVKRIELKNKLTSKDENDELLKKETQIQLISNLLLLKYQI